MWGTENLKIIFFTDDDRIEKEENKVVSLSPGIFLGCQTETPANGCRSLRIPRAESGIHFYSIVPSPTSFDRHFQSEKHMHSQESGRARYSVRPAIPKLLLTALIILLVSTSLMACNSKQETPAPTVGSAPTPAPVATSEPETTPGSSEEQTITIGDLPEEHRYYDIVFSGGGAKGIALVGAVRALEEQGVRYNRLIGTSAGTILAVLVAAGFTADELEAAMLERSEDGSIVMASFLETPTSFSEKTIRNSITHDVFLDLIPSFISDEQAEQMATSTTKMLLKVPLFREGFSFIEEGGIYSGDKAAEWLSEQLETKGEGLSEATLAEFHERTQGDFTAVATDATLGEMLILNHRTAPDLPIVEAARMSTAVPFVYQEVEWQPEWGEYLGVDISGHNIVDGGLSSNLAIELVLSLEPEILETMGGAPNREHVIGLFLDQNLAWKGYDTVNENEQQSENPLGRHLLGVKDRFMHILDTMLRSHDHFIANTHPDNVCHIPVKGYTTMDFHLSEEKMELLVDAGEDAMRQCLEENLAQHIIRE